MAKEVSDILQECLRKQGLSAYPEWSFPDPNLGSRYVIMRNGREWTRIPGVAVSAFYDGFMLGKLVGEQQAKDLGPKEES